LVTLLVACAWATAARVPDWLGAREVAAGAARARVPNGLRVRAVDGGGVVARRAPLTLAVQIGAAPDLPRASELLPDDPGVRALFNGPPARDESLGEIVPGTWRRVTDFVAPDTGAGFRLHMFRREEAFVVVFVQLAEGGEADGDEEAVQIGKSLAVVE
jgi:hypothetical protein